jgi:6-phosphofructokinase
MQKGETMRVGVLTGGGDCPGLNAVIRAVVRRGVSEFGFDFIGFRDGWRGPLEDGYAMTLDVHAVRGILPRGGTILGSSRTNPFKVDGGVDRLRENLAKLEVMGRHTGWIALHAGMAGGANVILIPEVPFDIEQVCGWVESRFRSNYSPIVVVAEGATPREGTMALQSGDLDAFGHVRLGGIGDVLAREIEQRTARETRFVVLGHVQRGGTPTAFDRWVATRFGLQAIAAVKEGAYGEMVALRGTEIVRVPLSDATKELKVVPIEQYEEAAVLFG